MPGAILTFLKHWRIILPLIAALLIGGFIFYQHAQLEKAARDVKEKTAELHSMRKSLEAIQRLSKAQETAIIKNQEKAAQNETDYQKIRSEIEAAGTGKDVAADPVLSGAIDSLRKHQLGK